MSLISRATGTVAAVALAASTVVVVTPISTQAADPQVCVTKIRPTAATQPWDDFAHSPNKFWKSKASFTTLWADISTAFGKLGPTSTEAEIDDVADAVSGKLEIWYVATLSDAMTQTQIDFYTLASSLGLIDPAAADAADAEIGSALETTLGPLLDGLTDGEAPLNTLLDTLFDNATGTYPLTGPVAIPSPAAAIASIGVVAQAVDQWHDLGTPHVVLGTTPSKTCTTTATLTVPAASTTFGKAKTVTITATREAVATRGDLVVLLDGKQIGSAAQESSYVATIPAGTAVGRHLLTVAFDPVDGSALSTSSGVVNVGKAKTASKLKLSKSRTKAGKPVKATITVAVPGTAVKASGVATVTLGKKTLKAKIRNGKGGVSLGRLPAGRYVVKATFAGTGSLAKSTTRKVTLVVAT
jgi:hypothetical protein